MASAQEIVNKAIGENDEQPEQYVDWLGKKTEVGEVGGLRFGIHIHTTDEDTIQQNAKEYGVQTDKAFWDQINSDSRWLEENAATLAREFGLYVQGEGHGETGDYVGSAWVSATAAPTWPKDVPLLQSQIAVAKKILDLDGEMPSTTDGTYWKFFPGSESKLYHGVSEMGAKYLDVVVEFTGTDVLAEWLKLNVVESQDPDDPQAFVKNFVPRLKGRLVIDYCFAVTKCPQSVYNNIDGLMLVRYKNKHEMQRLYDEMRHREALYSDSLKPKAYRMRVPHPARDAVVQSWLEQVVHVTPQDQAKIDEGYSNAEMTFEFPKQEFLNYLRYVYPQIKIRESTDEVDCAQVAWTDYKQNGGQLVTIGAEGFWGEHAMVQRDGRYYDRYSPHGVVDFRDSPWFEFAKDQGYNWKVTPMSEVEFKQFWLGQINESIDVDDPAAFVKNYRETRYKLFYGRKFGEGTFVGVYANLDDVLQSAKERKLRKRGRYVWASEEAYGDAPEGYVAGSEPTGNIFYVLKGYKLSEPQRVVVENEDVDSPEGYLDRVTGWIDKLLNNGMQEFDPGSKTHTNQFYKRYECKGANYTVYAHIKSPLWLLVIRTDPQTGRQALSLPFTFVDKDHSGVTNMFGKLDKLLTKATTLPRGDWTSLDAELIKLENRSEKDRLQKLQGRRKVNEAVDDPVLQSLLDKASPEPCFVCNADLTVPHSVIRTYVPKQEDLLDLQLEGHYSAEDGTFTPDERMTSAFLAEMPMYDLPDDCDNCAKCGSSTAKPGSMRNESIERTIAGPELEKRLLEIGTAQGGFLDSTLSAVNQRNFKLQQVSIGDLFLSDEAAAEAINGMEPRDHEVDGGLRSRDKVGPDVEPQDLYDEPIVVIDGNICDGYSRIKSHLDKGERTINAWVAESIDDVNPQQYVDQIHDLAEITHQIQNYGMFVNRIHPWGRWIVLSGGAYWATLHGGEDEEPLKADFFQAKIDEFMKKLGITQYHVKLGQTGTNNEHVWYQLGIPKAQLEQESWQPFIRNTSWPEASTDIAKWLPESNDPDAPESNVERHTADMDINAVMAKLGFTDSRTVGANWDGWTKQVGNKKWSVWPSNTVNIYGVTRLERPAKYVQVGRGRRHGQWSDKGHFTCHVTELEQQLREEGALQESQDPDDPSVNVERHVASMDINEIMERMGFFKHPTPSYQSDPDSHSYYDKYHGGLRYTVSNDKDEPQIASISVLRSKPLKGPYGEMPNYETIGSKEVHIGELESTLNAAMADPLTLIYQSYKGNYLASIGKLKESVDPDEPAPNIERFAQDTAVAEQKKLDDTINQALADFKSAVEMRGINNAKRADEKAVEVSTFWAEQAGYENGSDEFDHIVSAVNNLAGEMFPGDWEGYPVQEGVEHVTNWTEFLEPVIEAGFLNRKAAIKYQTRQNPEANEQIYNWFIEMDEMSQQGNDRDMLAAMRRIASVVNATNMRYGSAIKDITGQIGMDESEDVNPEQFVKSQPLEIVARIGSHGNPQDSLRFDAREWFEQATLEDILQLAKGDIYTGFQRSYSADNVARYLARLPHHQDLAKWMADKQDKWEVYISELDAKRWIEHERPDWFAYVWPNDMLPQQESVDDPSPEFINTALDVPSILKRFGFEEGPPNSWSKTYRRMPHYRDIMLIVTSRGNMPAGAQSTFDITVYHDMAQQGGGSTMDPIAYRYNRNGRNIEPALKALEKRIKENNLRGIREEPTGLTTESLDVDDPDSVLAAHTQEIEGTEAGKMPVINSHTHGKAQATLQDLGFEYSRVDTRKTVLDEPEVPGFWSKKYSGPVPGSGRTLWLKITTEENTTAPILTIRTRSMRRAFQQGFVMKPRTIDHILVIARDLDAAQQRNAADNVTPEQEVLALQRVVDHHWQWCRSS